MCYLNRLVIPVSFTCLVVTLASAMAQEVRRSNTLAQENSNLAVSENTAKGESVSELGPSAMYVFQAKNGDYWFGSNDRGVYRYDGKSIVNFTMKDGLCSNRIRGIQGDSSGNIYFTTYEGISKFSVLSFKTMDVVSISAPTAWSKQPNDLWFVGPPDAGVVYRSADGNSLRRLEFPKTKLGDEHFANMPRSKFPNAIYSPYDVYCIYKDSKGNLWFGTTCVGVCRYDGKSFDWLTDDLLVEALPTTLE